MRAVSWSRISPTMITSGSARRIERRPPANVTLVLSETCICLMPAIADSTGSSIVRIVRSPLQVQTTTLMRGQRRSGGKGASSKDFFIAARARLGRRSRVVRPKSQSSMS